MIRAESLRKTFRQEGHDIRAVDDLNFVLRPGETLGLVGESGSGKTTLARTLLGLIPADEGSVIELDGVPLEKQITKRGRDDVRALQIVFQNPDSALNRRFSVQRILSRALEKLRGDSGGEREEHLRELAHSVRFDTRLIHSRPAQLSGGLKQRVAIARAFAGEPRVVVCDEPTSALDVSVQAAILNLLAELQAEKGVTYLFISHDLGVVRYLSDRIAVLYLGRLMELGDAETVFTPPHHPYTEALLSSVPQVDGEERERIRLEGEIPSHGDPPSGCVFHTRCPRYIGDICHQQEPELKEVEPGHFWRCHYSRRGAARAAEDAPEQRPAGGPGTGGRDAAGERGPAGRRGTPGAPPPGASAEGPRRRPRAGRRAAGGDGARARAARDRARCSCACTPAASATPTSTRSTAPPRRAARRCSATRAPAWSRRSGEGVALAAGTRVVLSWLPACGRCAECLRDLPHLCAHGVARDGATAACSTARRGSRAAASRSTTTRSCPRSPSARSCRPRCCIPIPDGVPFEVAALAGCAVATGTGAVWRTAGVRPGERVAVIGCGGVGMSAVLGAVAVGAHPVVAVDVSQDKLAAAEELGATHAVQLGGERRGDRRARARGHAAAASTTRSRRRAARRRRWPRSSRPARAAPRC